MKKSIFFTNGAGTTGHPMQKSKLNSYLTPRTQISSKCINYLNTGANTTKLLEKNIKANLHDLRFENGLWDMTPNAWVTKENNKMDFIKIKNFCVLKNIMKKVKTISRMGENTCKSVSDKGQVFWICKNSCYLIVRWLS